MLLLTNTVQTYAWGRLDGLAPIVGSEPTGGPEAELWVGTHPAAPSVVVDDPEGRTLAEVIASDPSRWLGPGLADAGHTALPFLLKVLAIGTPLSLQAHPSAEQAATGFVREEEAGIDIGARNRTYRDPNPKPEALVALSDTWALCGFRDPADAAALVQILGVPALDPLVSILRGGGGRSLHDALAWLLHLQGADVDSVVASAADAASSVSGDTPDDPMTWVVRLAGAHPDDPTVLAPLLMQVVRLVPGQAVHLPAGNLHAYLEGAGIEVMQASDNVLRGGLTSKHIDVDELLSIIRFEPGMPAPPVHKDHGNGLHTYDAGEETFGLALVIPGEATVDIAPTGPSLLLATHGRIDIAGDDGGISLDGGDAAFTAPREGSLTVSGPGQLWWATTGDDLPV